jgi:hypothetical protein
MCAAILEQVGTWVPFWLGRHGTEIPLDAGIRLDALSRWTMKRGWEPAVGLLR